MSSSTGEGRPRLTRQEAKARTHGLLLDAAAEVIAKKGYAGASVDDIAEAAGFTTGALYAHFTGKEELFIELLTSRSSTQATDAIAIVADPDTPIEERRTALARYLIDVAEKNPDLAVLEAEFWLYAMRRPEFQRRLGEQIRINRDALADALAAWSERHQHSGDIPYDQLATTLLALFRGLVQLRRTDADLVPDELYATGIRWIFAGVISIYDTPPT